MKSSLKRLVFALLMLTVLMTTALAQTSSTDTGLVSTQFDTTGFPQWAKDLRRAEIVAFGSFPFTVFFARFAIDTYRCATNGWDIRYAPWPFKPAGAIEMPKEQQLISIAVAAAGSVMIALTDFLIVTYKRHKKARDLKNLPEGSPIIIKTPWPAETAADEEPGDGTP
ncbi:MAG: hypothetical protein LBU17_00825 [Treponema sp.]|jgi:hypothetical protein|nr:hypothetical protein [Treponema sp.]